MKASRKRHFAGRRKGRSKTPFHVLGIQSGCLKFLMVYLFWGIKSFLGSTFLGSFRGVC